MSYSEEFLYNKFKKCYEQALEAKRCGDMATAKSRLEEAADLMEKLSILAEGGYREKYSESAEKIRSLASSLPPPEYPKATGGHAAATGNAAQNISDESEMGQYFTILAKERLTYGFEGVIGLDGAKAAVTEYIINPVRYPEAYNYNFVDNQAILLEGPPGTGKTTFAKAVAKETGLPFALIKVGALVNYYIGETGKNIDKIFAYLREYSQRHNTPVIVFLDEFDELAKKRGGDDKVSEAAVPALLRNLDGAENNKNMFVIANTNCADLLDEAVAERFRRVIHIPLPDICEREELFKAKLSEVEERFMEQTDLKQAASDADGLSGRDITYICDDFKRMLAKIKAHIAEGQDLNAVLHDLISERKGTKIKGTNK